MMNKIILQLWAMTMKKKWMNKITKKKCRGRMSMKMENTLRMMKKMVNSMGRLMKMDKPKKMKKNKGKNMKIKGNNMKSKC